jgi:hypothetical protein
MISRPPTATTTATAYFATAPTTAATHTIFDAL